MTEPNIDYLNGVLQSFKYVNCKTDHGLEYYIRAMGLQFNGLSLPYEPECIHSCFEKQLEAIDDSYVSTAPKKKTAVLAEYRVSNWEQVLVALKKWLFLYLTDSDGLKLMDPTNAFSLSDCDYRDSIAKLIQGQMQAAIGEATLKLAENANDRFFGYLFLFDAGSSFYELRLGTHY